MYTLQDVQTFHGLKKCKFLNNWQCNELFMGGRPTFKDYPHPKSFQHHTTRTFSMTIKAICTLKSEQATSSISLTWEKE